MVVKTGDDDATQQGGVDLPLEEKLTDLVAAPVVGSIKAGNESEVPDKSNVSLQLSLSADEDIPTGNESKQSTDLSVNADDDLPPTDMLVEEANKFKISPAVADAAAPSVSGDSTSTKESYGEPKAPSYPPPPGLRNIISQSQTTVPPAVPIQFPSPIRSMRKEIKYWSFPTAGFRRIQAIRITSSLRRKHGSSTTTILLNSKPTPFRRARLLPGSVTIQSM
jgi:hypothetical protein